MIPNIIKSNSITLFLSGEPKTINDQHPNFSSIRKALIEKNYSVIQSLIDNPAPKAMAVFSSGKVKYVNGAIVHNGVELHTALTKRILQMRDEGFPFENMLVFLENLYKNPSKNSVDQLYYFLEHKNLPITEDGHFLAYKAVKSNYFDKYTGTIDNSIGKIVEMPRNEVTDNYKLHCSPGLHCGAMDYVKTYGTGAGDRFLVVKVNPADAVSVPDDLAYTKLRVCRYEVIGELSNPNNIYTKSVVNTSVGVANGPLVEDDEEIHDAKPSGYDLGYTRGKEDAEEGLFSPKGYWSSDYRDGYEDAISDAEEGVPFEKTAPKKSGYELGYERGQKDAKTFDYDPQDHWSTEYTNGYEDGYDSAPLAVKPGIISPISPTVNKEEPYTEEFIDYIGEFITESNCSLTGDLRDGTPYTSKFSRQVDKLIREFGENKDLNSVLYSLTF